MIVEQMGRLNEMRVVLASQSPRRREILSTLGLKNVEVEVSRFVENLDKRQFVSAEDYVLANASGKAKEVAQRLAIGTTEGPDLVIGSDTVVVLDGEILEKPESEKMAFDMLSRLR
uniref:Septum formation protein Maf n=1 Tax=Compsopogon caeruleus TaxID=31354 RepID=A0A7S1TAN4_9RHOD|mmetsp:Transcript_14778/g.30069  ORF Transcript_14778/g.30069 Transcript_14778/m.30069 type:complete len:116 (+) Transcript_14778:54-401(+)